MGIQRTTRTHSAERIQRHLSYADYTYQKEGIENQRLIAFNQDGGTFWDLTHVGIGKDWSEAMSEDSSLKHENEGVYQVVLGSMADQLS